MDSFSREITKDSTPKDGTDLGQQCNERHNSTCVTLKSAQHSPSRAVRRYDADESSQDLGDVTTLGSPSKHPDVPSIFVSLKKHDQDTGDPTVDGGSARSVGKPVGGGSVVYVRETDVFKCV